MCKDILSKKEIRHDMINKRKNLTHDEVITKSSKICTKIINNDCYNNAEIIFCYSAINNEVDLEMLIKHAILHNKKIAFPKVISKYEMRFFYVNSLSDMKEGYYNILEPDTSRPATKADLIIVPGVAFNKEGFRLGYGGGFYDRFFEENTIYSIGVGYDFQLIENMPVMEHDKKLNQIITD